MSNQPLSRTRSVYKWHTHRNFPLNLLIQPHGVFAKWCDIFLSTLSVRCQQSSSRLSHCRHYGGSPWTSLCSLPPAWSITWLIQKAYGSPLMVELSSSLRALGHNRQTNHITVLVEYTLIDVLSKVVHKLKYFNYIQGAPHFKFEWNLGWNKNLFYEIWSFMFWLA